jgi:F-type H+-transporting ATPase subunit b
MSVPMFRARLATTALLLGTAAGAAHADTMPQLQFSNPLLVSQVVWGAVIFAGFYWLVSRVGLPQVDAALALRAQTIGAELDAARASKQAADAAVAELTEARRRAYAQSQAAIASATASAKAAAAAHAESVNARLDQQLAESEARIGQTRSAAMASLGDIAADTAEAVFLRLTGLTPDAGRVRSAVGAILSERGHAVQTTADLV